MGSKCQWQDIGYTLCRDPQPLRLQPLRLQICSLCTWGKLHPGNPERGKLSPAEPVRAPNLRV
eukprot:1800651-Rhodomonas_salina.1